MHIRVRRAVIVLALVAFALSTQRAAADDCGCGCDPGEYPTDIFANFSITVRTNYCDIDGEYFKEINVSQAGVARCAGGCKFVMMADFDVDAWDCKTHQDTSYSDSGAFIAERFGTSPNQGWRIIFNESGFTYRFVVSEDQTATFSAGGSPSDDYITSSSWSCNSATATWDQTEDDDPTLFVSMTFSSSGSDCVKVPAGATAGDCGRPNPTPIEEDKPDEEKKIEPDPPNESGGGGGNPEDDFPCEEGEEESGGECGGGDDDDESCDPINYLTGHKIERARDIHVMLPGKDFSISREYTSDPDYYATDSGGDYFWNGGVTDVEPGLAGVRWSFNVFKHITNDSGDLTERLYLHGMPLNSIRAFDKLSGQSVYAAASASNAYIVPDTESSITWLNTAGATETGSNVKVWRLRTPGLGERVFARVDDSYTPVDGEIDRSDLYGELLYEIDEYGNIFEYRWTTLGTDGNDREIMRLDEIICMDSSSNEHAKIELDWHGESGTGLASASTQNNAAGEWVYGRIDEIRVKRPEGGSTWTTTQRVQYVHFDEIEDILESTVVGSTLKQSPERTLGDSYDGSPGDLCEVIRSTLVDEDEGDSDGFYDRVTQYRYYRESFYGPNGDQIEADSAIDGLAGLDVTGQPHQMMAVIYPQQIEYYASRVFNLFDEISGDSLAIQDALGVTSGQVSAITSDVYSSTQAFDTVVDAAERLRWVSFQDPGYNSAYLYSQALLFPNGDWSTLFDLSSKFITYYSDMVADEGENDRVRTQFVSSGANGCGCGGSNPTIGLGRRYDYLYRRYQHGEDLTPPATVVDGTAIDLDGYTCLMVESHIDLDSTSLAYVPYRVHCQDYYWPTSLTTNGMIYSTAADDINAVSRSGIRKLARALCTADPAWATTDEFDPYEDPIDATGPMWATARVYGNDSTDPGSAQFNNFGTLTMQLSQSAVEASTSGYAPVADSQTNTVAPTIPQASSGGRVIRYEYTDGYLSKQSVEKGTSATGDDVKVLAEYTRGGANDRPDLFTQSEYDAGDGVVMTTDIDYGYYDSTNTTDINGAIVAWSKASPAPESPSQNGPATGYEPDYDTWSFFDRLGQLRWTRDAGGTLTYYEYGEHTGQMTRMIQDADPGDTSIPSAVTINDTNFPGITAAGWSLPTRTNYHELEATYVHDLMGRQIEHTDTGGVTRYTRRVVKDSNYVDATGILVDHGVALQATMSFPHELTGGTFDGPITIDWMDASGSNLRSSSFVSTAIMGYDPTAGTYTIGDQVARSDQELAVTGSTVRSRQWYDVEASTAASGSFYTETRYDGLGRVLAIIDPLGGVTQYGTSTIDGYDIMDRPLATAQGVKSGGTITVDLVSEMFYDSDQTETSGIGDGLVTLSKVYTGEGSESRVTKKWYNFRNQLVGQKNPEAPHQIFGYDTLGRMIETATWTDGTDFTDGDPSSVPEPSQHSSKRSTYSKSFYNNRGMVYRQVTPIDPSEDPAGMGFSGYLETNTWYDPDGLAVATWSPGSPASKTAFDELDRPLVTYITDRAGDGLAGAGSYEEVFDSAGTAIDLGDDHVLQQVEYEYLEGGTPGAGRVEITTSRLRLHGDTSTSGALGGSTSIAMFMVSNFDSAGRVIDSLNYGTNDSGGGFVTGTSAPTSIDTDRGTSPALITSTEFDSWGRVRIQTDPAGKETLTVYDDLSRTIATVENRTSSFDETDITWDSNDENWDADLGMSPEIDENRVTSFVYDNASNVIKRTAYLSNSDIQVTAYDYGVTSSATSGPLYSRVSSPSMLSKVHYPNETTGEADTSAAYTVEYAYNRLGERRGMKDQNGTIHEYTRDGLGRVTSDHVNTFGTDIDQGVAEITTSYDNHGRISGVYSWDDSMTPVELNSVEYEYSPRHEIEAIVQNVDVDGGSSDERVEYTYDPSEPTASGGNYSRLSAITYPAQAGGSDDTVVFDYTGTINDDISRLNGLDVVDWDTVPTPSDNTLVRYEYLGAGMIVQVDYHSASVKLNYFMPFDGSTTAAAYPGFDKFGRVVWHPWVGDAYATGQTVMSVDYPNTSPLVARRYEYDVMGNRTLDWDGRPGAVMDDRDWEYDYDGLDRLVEASRGQWDPGAGPAAMTLADDSVKWNLDSLGNWNSVVTDFDGDGLFETGLETEVRDHNLANEIIEREGIPGSGPGGATPLLEPEHDAAGNFKNNGGSGTTGLIYAYDAWNRLVSITRDVPGGPDFTILENEFNGVGWRVIRRMDLSDGAYDGIDESRRYYFSGQWQMIEEHVDSDYNGSSFSQDYASQQYWGGRYIDDAVAKRIDTDNDDDWSEGDQFMYLTDAMFSVRAMTDDSGYVRERIDYTPYGRAIHRYGGDFVPDGSFDQFDISAFTTHASTGGSPLEPGDSGYNPNVDTNGDAIVGQFDLGVLTADDSWVDTGGNGLPASGWLSDPARVGSVGTDNQIGFDGYWQDVAGSANSDTAGLYCVRNRVYDVTAGRWLTGDPLYPEDGLHKFHYVSNSPTDYSDPSGLIKINVEFNAFIGGFRGGWLVEPDPVPGPPFVDRISWWQFKTDGRGFGQSNHDIVTPNSRIMSLGWFETSLIGSGSSSAAGGWSRAGLSHRRLVGRPHNYNPWNVGQDAYVVRSETYVARSMINNPLASITKNSACVTELKFCPSANYPFISQSPRIDYCVTFIAKDLGNGFVTFGFYGDHDGFPDYEAYISGVGYYQHRSPHAGPTPLPNNLGPPMDVEIPSRFKNSVSHRK